MFDPVPLEAVDYLLIGHVTVDLTPSGPRLGGTASYAALAARALGLRVGIVTSCAPDAPLGELAGLPIVSIPSEHSTTFENIPTPQGRKQILHHRAAPLAYELVPAAWRATPIVHLAPLVYEIFPGLAAQVRAPLVGITPQGWLRAWDAQGQIHPCTWEDAETVLPHIGAMVISREDVGGDEEQIEFFAHHVRVLAVTEGAAGSVLHWHGDRRHFPAPKMDEVDSTGAGDIYAAAFFFRMYTTRDPWEAARFATQFAAYSVTRPGLEGIPTQSETQACMMEVLS
jgi:sugar/nucleoside kinase (ribokinase family)